MWCPKQYLKQQEEMHVGPNQRTQMVTFAVMKKYVSVSRQCVFLHNRSAVVEELAHSNKEREALAIQDNHQYFCF